MLLIDKRPMRDRVTPQALEVTRKEIERAEA